MTGEKAKKMCPLFWAAAESNSEHNGKGTECIEGACAWWVESKEMPPNERGEIHYSKPRCGMAR